MVLTDSYCVRHDNVQVSEKQLVVTLGNNDLYNFENEFEVNEIILDWRNELAILVLKQAALLGPHIQPICLWPKLQRFADFHSNHNEVAGRGDELSPELSKTVRRKSVDVRDALKCLKKNISYADVMEDGDFCAEDRFYNNGTTVCLGDTGGSFYRRIYDSYFLRGIITKVPNTLTIDKPCAQTPSMIIKDIVGRLDWIEAEVA